MDTKKMRACAPLLPPPGVIECLDEIEALQAQIDALMLEAENDTLKRRPLQPNDAKDLLKSSEHGQRLLWMIKNEIKAGDFAATVLGIVREVEAAHGITP